MVSFIIINYNSIEYTIKAIKSIRKYFIQEKFEIILIDNNSKEEIVQDCLENNVIFEKLDKNYGFGGAVNKAIKYVSGDIIVIFNNDAEMSDYEFYKIIEKVKNDNSIGVCGPIVKYPNGIIQNSGQAFPTLITLFMQILNVGKYIRKFNLNKYLLKIIKFIKNREIDYYLKNYSDKKCKYNEYDWISGACMVIRKEVFIKAGGFDENIFLYGEDLELCWRIKLLKLKCIVSNESVVYHHVGISSKSSKEKIKIRKNSSSYVLKKILNPIQYWVFKKFIKPIWR